MPIHVAVIPATRRVIPEGDSGIYCGRPHQMPIHDISYMGRCDQSRLLISQPSSQMRPCFGRVASLMRYTNLAVGRERIAFLAQAHSRCASNTKRRPSDSEESLVATPLHSKTRKRFIKQLLGIRTSPLSSVDLERDTSSFTMSRSAVRLG
jgi:hypothetical protein